MKKYLLLIFSVFFVTLTSAQIRNMEVQDLEQNWISLEKLNGEKLTVLDFWATWCKPCVSSIPKINALYHQFSNEGVAFVGVNTDGPRNQAKVKPFANSLNIEYPVVLDPDLELVNEFNITVFPSLIVLDSKGDEVFIHEGYNPGDELAIKNNLEKLLANEK
ncbi:TlpA family protein disulfide reductase [Maribellus comscasis]|nr:TlpA disulfide reductase family protein [Maribellus comscasis]